MFCEYSSRGPGPLRLSDDKEMRWGVGRWGFVHESKFHSHRHLGLCVTGINFLSLMGICCSVHKTRSKRIFTPVIMFVEYQI